MKKEYVFLLAIVIAVTSFVAGNYNMHQNHSRWATASRQAAEDRFEELKKESGITNRYLQAPFYPFSAGFKFRVALLSPNYTTQEMIRQGRQVGESDWMISCDEKQTQEQNSKWLAKLNHQLDSVSKIAKQVPGFRRELLYQQVAALQNEQDLILQLVATTQKLGDAMDERIKLQDENKLLWNDRALSERQKIGMLQAANRLARYLNNSGKMDDEMRTQLSAVAAAVDMSE